MKSNRKAKYIVAEDGSKMKVPKITKGLIRHHEDNYEVMYNLGTFSMQNREWGPAHKMLKKAIEIKKTPESLINFSTVQRELDLTKESERTLRDCIESFPDFPLAYNNLGLMLYDYRKVDEAIELYDKALALNPNYADANWNKALALLLKYFDNKDKDYFDKGMQYYWWRFKKTNPVKIASAPSKPWNGQPLQEGEKLMLLCEQGYGDMIQFMRYAYEFRPDQIILHLPKELHCLVKPGYKAVDISLEPHTYHCPIVSVSQYFSEIKGQPYMDHLKDQVHDFGGGYNIGLVWKGNRAHQNDRNRSQHFRDFYWLFKHGNVYSLQKDAELPKSVDKIKQLKISTFLDTVRYINGLDVVVTVDTSVAHLAGALGKPVIVLIPKFGIDWRWGETSETSVWYDTMKLARDLSHTRAEEMLIELKNNQAS